MEYIMRKFRWFLPSAILSVGGSILVVALQCPLVWLRVLCGQYLRFGFTVIGVGLAAHYIGEALPRRWFRYDAKPFAPWKWENGGKLYEQKLHISKWKDAMPDKSQAVKRSVTKTVSGNTNGEQLNMLLAETCVSETMHWALLIISPIMFVTMRLPGSVLGWLIYAGSNLPLIAIQRYNRPRLVVLLRLEERKNARKAAKRAQ